VAGATRQTCPFPFLALGDYLAMQDPTVSDSSTPGWLLPELQTTSSPGTTLGGFLKALLTKCAC
jgi:hypothetical protein